jgi:catechol 2,3-dioxygenase-like lactoylglutathione lyase family enzyme
MPTAPVATPRDLTELIEPVAGASVHTEFLARSGPGLHHVCFAVDDIDAACARAAAGGVLRGDLHRLIRLIRGRASLTSPAIVGRNVGDVCASQSRYAHDRRGSERTMTGVLKKGMVVLVVVFVGFYMFTDPSGLAQTTKDGGGALWEALSSLFGALIDFINSFKS